MFPLSALEGVWTGAEPHAPFVSTPGKSPIVTGEKETQSHFVIQTRLVVGDPIGIIFAYEGAVNSWVVSKIEIEDLLLGVTYRFSIVTPHHLNIFF